MRYALTILLIIIAVTFNYLKAQTANIVVNEVSQVCGGAEYIELLVYGEPVCNEIPTIDIRGWIIDDNDGSTYGTSGVASGCIRLSQDAYWSNIKIGTLILIYRENPASPCSPEYPSTFPADDIYDTNEDCIHVIPFGPSTPSTLFEIHETKPSSGTPGYAAINDAGWINSGFDWQVIGMANGGDVIQIINPASLTSVHAVAWGSANQNPIVYVNDNSASGNVYFMDNSVDNDPFNTLNWQSQGVADNDALEDQTPANPNNSANATWISGMNYGCGTIDTLNIDSVFTDPSCGSCDGSVGVNFLGGISPFIYSWDNGTSSQSINSLCNGDFKVTVTDNNGCIDSTAVSITSPVAFTATASTLQNESCDGVNDGSVTVTTTGTVGVVTYQWSNGGNQSTETGLGNGIYTVTVTDGSGCFDIQSTTVTAGTSLTVANSAVAGQCFDVNNFSFDGTGTEAPNSCGAGCPSYTWNFDDGNTQTGITASDLTPSHSYSTSGNYNVSLTVFDGTCSSTSVTSINVYSEPTVTLTSSDISCNGANNGSASANVSNGNPTYNYSWSNGETIQSITDLSPQEYSVTVNDINNCTVTESISISEPTAINIAHTFTTVSCNNASDGSISISVTGGATDYTYAWSNGETTEININIPTGNYTISVTDDNGCIQSKTIYIDEPTAITSSITSTNSTCNGATGTASVSATGGTNPYTYLWNTNETTSSISGLEAASYSVAITDDNQCSVLNSIIVNEENFVSVSIASNTSITTPGGSDGAISIVSSGGVPNYTYLWSNAETTQNISNLTSGQYCITVYDDNLCSSSICDVIEEPSNIKVTITPADVLCFGESTGSISSVVTDGTSPYSYEWNSSPSNIIVGMNSTISGLSVGDYYLLVTDQSGYTVSSATVTINQSLPITSNLITANMSCNGLCDGSLSVSGNGGTAPYTYDWSNLETANQISNLCDGSYHLTISDANNCVNNFDYIVAEPTPLLANYNITDTLVCIGQSIELTVNPSGGTLPYPASADDAITWSDAGTGLTGYGSHILFPESSVPEVYSFTVYDANGCSTSNQVTIRTPEELNLIVSDSVALCLGENTEFCAEGSGGADTSNYQFIWSNGVLESGVSTSCQLLTQTGTTTYRIILSDGCSPKDTAYTTVYVNQMPSISFGALNNEGCPPFTTNFSATSSIDNSIFEWDMNGDGIIDTTGAIFNYSYNESGVYDVIVLGTSPEGCSISDTIFNYINVYPSPEAIFELTPKETSILNPFIKVDGSSSLNADSLFLWDFGDGNTGQGLTSSNTYTTDGIYEVALTTFNSNGCFDTDTQTVVITPEFTIYIPNAFNPLGYGYNDYFFPEGIGIDPARYELYIFDRWGHQIFHTNDLAEYWDGTIRESGKLGPVGVYVYKIYVADINTGQQHKYVGHVTLIK